MYESWREKSKNELWRSVPFELGFWRKRLEEAKTPEARDRATQQVAWLEAANQYLSAWKRARSTRPLLRAEPGPMLT